jgi:hypothetical protein
MLVLGACWCRHILGRKSILGAGLFLGEISVLGTCPFLERKTYFWSACSRQQVAGKKHAEKEGKVTCRRKINVAHMHIGLTMLRLGFLTNIVMAISL